MTAVQSGGEVTRVETTVLETEADPEVRTRRGNGAAGGGGGGGSDAIDGDGVRECSEHLEVLKMALRGLTGMAAHGHTVVALIGRGTWG